MRSKLRTPSATIFIISNTIGISLVEIPRAFSYMGAIISFFTLLFFSFFSLICLFFLVSAAEISKKKGYVELCATFKFGKPIFLLCNSANSILTASSLFFYITENTFSFLEVTNWQKIQRFAFSFLFSVPIFFFSQTRFRKSFFVFFAIFLCAVFAVFPFPFFDAVSKKNREDFLFFPSDFLRGFSFVMFSVMAQTSVNAAAERMEGCSLRSIFKVCILVATFNFFILLLVGFFSLHLFGTSEDVYKLIINENFIQSLDVSLHIIPRICFIALIFMLFLAIIVHIDIFCESIAQLFGLPENSNSFLIIIFFCGPTLFFVFDFETDFFLRLAGAFFCPLLGFFFPSLIFVKFKRFGPAKMLGILSLILSLICVGVGVYSVVN